MRITPSLLHKIARDTVTQRIRSDRSVLSVYLSGSLLENDPLFGGTADIDLVFIHLEPVTAEREIQRLSDEVHLDIAHYERGIFQHARDLRLHPWLGPSIINCKIMYDPQHFMNFTQASVRGQFDQPEYVLGRARGLVEHARQIWLELHDGHAKPGAVPMFQYLRAVEHAANAIAALSGQPLTERRFLLLFPSRADAVGQPGLYRGLLGLLGAHQTDPDILTTWMPDWDLAYQTIPVDKAPPRLHAERYLYYRQAFDKHIRGAYPHNVLWPLLNTWTRAILLIPTSSPAREAWEKAMGMLGFLGADFKERVAALDAYLDSVEEILDRYAQKSGIEEE
jgi:hypothetical protein